MTAFWDHTQLYVGFFTGPKPASARATRPIKMIYLKPGAYEFQVDQTGWTLGEKAITYHARFLNKDQDLDKFHYNLDSKAVPSDDLETTADKVITDRIPITVHYDPGNGQGLVSQPLRAWTTSKEEKEISEAERSRIPTFKLGLNAATNLLELVETTPAGP